MAISVFLDSSLVSDEKSFLQGLSLNLDTSPHSWILLRKDRVLMLTHALIATRNPLSIDFCTGHLAHRRKYSLGKNQILGKALGLKYSPQTIFDSTAGLGKDAFTFAALGLHVTAIEENPLIFLLLKDAHRRLSDEDPDIADRLCFKFGSAIDHITDKFDIAYMDPMFPEKKKVALSSGDLQWLQELVVDSSDPHPLLEKALCCAKKRVVVKRPLRAPPLKEPVSHSFHGQSVRYDMYLAQSPVLRLNQERNERH